MRAQNAQTADLIPVVRFRLGDSQYALLVDDVVEVAAMVAVAPVTDAPPAVLGLANRHGEPLPLLDLRLVFQQPATPLTDETLFVVVQSDGHLAGFVLDEIYQVDYILAEHFKPMAAAGAYIRSIISHEDGLVQVIHPAPIFKAFLTATMSTNIEAGR